VRLDRVLVVDDEAPARRHLSRMLRELAEIGEVLWASGVAAAARVLAAGPPPDGIFLDVQMPLEDGFALFERCAVSSPVVFVTAYHQHAVRAFEVNAVDYLLKPVLRERLAAAIARLELAREHAAPAMAFEPGPFTLDDVVLVRDRSRQLFVTLADLVWISAADDYTKIHLAGGAAHLCSFTMRDWESRLPTTAGGFVRIHRSTIVGTRHVLELHHIASGAYLVVRGSSQPLRVARAHLPALKAMLEAGH
jgi:two-component system LytT family response regulator